MADTENSQELLPQNEEDYESSDMNYIEELPKHFLDTIAPQIYALPERIRNEDEGKYTFPEEYHNKIYRFNNKFLLFNSTSYEEVSYSTVSFFLKLAQLFGPDSSTVEGISESSEHLQTLIQEAYSRIQFISDKIQEIENKSNTEPKESLSNIEIDLQKIIASYNEDNNKLLQTFEEQKEEIKTLKEKINNIENQFKDFKLPEVPIVNSSIDENELINKIGTEIWNKLQNEENNYLNISLFNQFKESFEHQLSILNNKISTVGNKNTNEIKTNIDDYQPLSDVLKQFQVIPTDILVHLKLAGFTSEEILQLREKGALGEYGTSSR